MRTQEKQTNRLLSQLAPLGRWWKTQPTSVQGVIVLSVTSMFAVIFGGVAALIGWLLLIGVASFTNWLLDRGFAAAKRAQRSDGPLTSTPPHESG